MLSRYFILILAIQLMVSKTSETAFVTEKFNNGFLSFKLSYDGLEEQVSELLAQTDAALALTRYRLIIDLTFESYAEESQDLLLRLSSHIYIRGTSKTSVNPFFDLIVTFSNVFPLDENHEYLKTLDVVFQTSISQALLKGSILTHDLGPINKPCADSELFQRLLHTEKKKIEAFSRACLGGTFDYLHSGHKMLLTGAVFGAKSLVVGLTSDELLLKKNSKAALESYQSREYHLLNFLTLVGSTRKFEVHPLRDVAGPAATIEDLEAIFLTPETQSGGEFVNQKRKEKNFKELNVIVIDLLWVSEKAKLSSTDTRQFIIKQVKGGEECLKKLYENWNALNKNIGVENQRLMDLWFDRFKHLFSEPWRYYHNFNHIEALLSLIPEIKSEKDENTLGLLAWFHDAIYVPMRPDNEEKSADLFLEYINELTNSKIAHKLDERTIQHIKNVILHTKNHTKKNPEVDEEINAQLFLDMDLSILGAEPEQYDQYSKNIRLEYIHYPDEAFRPGRKKVLQTFIESTTPLFKTKEFQERYRTQPLNIAGNPMSRMVRFGKKAQENLQREIELLSS